MAKNGKLLENTGIVVYDDRSSNVIDKVMGADYEVPGAGTTEGLWDFIDEFMGTYLNDARDVYSGLNASGGTPPDYKVKVEATDIPEYLSSKINGLNGIIATVSGGSNKVIDLSLDIQETSPVGGVSLLNNTYTLKQLNAENGTFISSDTDKVNISIDIQETSPTNGVSLLNNGYTLKQLTSSDGSLSLTENIDSIDVRVLVGKKILYNPSITTAIPSGTTLHLISAIEVLGETYPVFEYAKADKFETCQGSLVFASEDIPPESTGKFEFQAPNISADTSGLDLVTYGAQLWLSTTVAGDFTNIRPTTGFKISLGGSYNSQVNGNIWANITSSTQDVTNCAFIGGMVESFKFTISSDGAIVTGLLENSDDPAKDLTMFLPDLESFDTTTAPATVVLTAGTDELEQVNYIYIPESTKALTASTAGWPSENHCRISESLIGLATTVQTDSGAVRNQNLNDHLEKLNGNGHILHMAARLRKLPAEHESGCLGALSGATNRFASIDGGVVDQMHEQTFPALSMPTDSIRIVNDFNTANRQTTDLGTIQEFSDGTAWTGWSNLVLWGVINSAGDPCFMMMNLPNGGYNSELRAFEDRDNHANYDIPKKYRGVGFLVARFTVNIAVNGDITYDPNTGYKDLRGFFPNQIAGGGGGGGAGAVVPANTIIVDQLATYGFSSIQAAIVSASAVEETIIIIYPGTYVENLDMLGKPLILSADAPNTVFIDGTVLVDDPTGGFNNINIKSTGIVTDNYQAVRVTSNGNLNAFNLQIELEYAADIGLTALQLDGDSNALTIGLGIKITKTVAHAGVREVKCINAPGVLTPNTVLLNNATLAIITPDNADKLYGIVTGGSASIHFANYLFNPTTYSPTNTCEIRMIQFTTDTTPKTFGSMTYKGDDSGNATVDIIDVTATTGDFQFSECNAYNLGGGVSNVVSSVNVATNITFGGGVVNGFTNLATGVGASNVKGGLTFNGVAKMTTNLNMTNNAINQVKNLLGDGTGDISGFVDASFTGGGSFGGQTTISPTTSGGTSSPDDILTVDSATNGFVKILTASTGAGGYSWGNNLDAFISSIDVNALGNNRMRFYHNNADRGGILADGTLSWLNPLNLNNNPINNVSSLTGDGTGDLDGFIDGTFTGEISRQGFFEGVIADQSMLGSHNYAIDATQRKDTAFYTHSTVTNSDRIQVLKAGDYKISVDMSGNFTHDGTAQLGVELRIETSTDGGSSWNDSTFKTLTESTSTSLTSDCNWDVHRTKILTLAANEIIRIWSGTSTTGSISAASVFDEFSGITIEKIS
jgi:hypothetical protein